MKTPKLISISLLGLALNSLFNGIYIIQIARVSNSELLAQSMVMWSGFFVAGACIAPFENYFLYRRMDGAKEYSHVKVLILSGLLFLIVGLSISLTQSVNLWTLPLTLLVGLCVGQIVSLRSEAIYQKKLTRVSLSNLVEGVSRAALLFFFVSQFETVTFWHILISYTGGNLASLFPYFNLKREIRPKKLASLPSSKIYGLAIIGLFAALITGGLPYMSGFFEADDLSAILFFFTLSRSLLIFQSVLVYVKPQLAKNLGGETSIIKQVKYSVFIFTLTFLLLISIKYVIELILNVSLASIKNYDITYFSIALVVSAYFNLKVASQNATSQWSHALSAVVLGFLTGCASFVVIDSAVHSFYVAMILAPTMGILSLIQLAKSRDIAE